MCLIVFSVYVATKGGVYFEKDISTKNPLS